MLLTELCLFKNYISLFRLGNNFVPVVISPVDNAALPIPEPLPEPECRSLQEIKDTSPYDFPVCLSKL